MRYRELGMTDLDQRQKFFIGFIFLCLFLIVVLDKQIADNLKSPQPSTVPTGATTAGEEARPNHLSPVALRIERKASGADFTESMILVNQEKVAQFTAKDDQVFDSDGEIPDGKIRFVNEEENTYGFEHYQDGQREGKYVEYYNTGRLKTEAAYHQGQLVQLKNYSYDGDLRLEADYKATYWLSKMLPSSRNKYLGMGKLYRPDGSLKYEWSFVDDSDRNFTKTYNGNGEVAGIDYYNEQGELVDHWEPPSTPTNKSLPLR